MRFLVPYALVWVFYLPVCFSDPHFRWVEGENCPKGKGTVTDRYCCNDEKFCSAFKTEKACVERDGGALNYCNWREGICLPLVDSRSDVCCVKGTVGSACHSLLRGECPDDWQVDEQCCTSAAARKYSWLTANEGKVCCNAPCQEAEKSGCKNLPVKCAPSQRSWAMFKPHQALGFNFGSDSDQVIRDFKFGNVLSGTGFNGDKPRYAQPEQERYGHDGNDFSKDKHLEEITVDDVFMLLIEAFEKDSDVKLYDSDISSDPRLGKTKSGGLFVDHLFPDADDYLDGIYGQPGSGQIAYGVPAYGVPAYGVPAYGVPAYGVPSYGVPSYGVPSYGVPTYGPPFQDFSAYGSSTSYGPPAYGSLTNRPW